MKALALGVTLASALITEASSIESLSSAQTRIDETARALLSDLERNYTACGISSAGAYLSDAVEAYADIAGETQVLSVLPRLGTLPADNQTAKRHLDDNRARLVRIQRAAKSLREVCGYD